MPSIRMSVEEYDVERRKCEDAGKSVDESFIIIKREGSQDIIYKIVEEDEEYLQEKIREENFRKEKIREDARLKKIRDREDARLKKIRDREDARIKKIRDREEARLKKIRDREEAKAKEKLISNEYQSSDDEIMAYIKIYNERRPDFDIERIEDKKILRLIIRATREGCDTDKEIFDFIKKRRVSKPKVEFAPAIKRMIPKIEDEFDIRYDAGDELVVEFPVESFLLEMGQERTTYLDLGYSRVLASIKRTLQYEGINIRYSEKNVGNDIKQYFTLWALTEDEAKKIEEQDNKIRRQTICRKMAKKVCKNKVHNKDDNSLWKDTEFIKDISGCSFDMSKVEEKVKKMKESLFNDTIMDGFGLLFE